MKFKPGDKVKTIENHTYLGLTKRNVGIILDYVAEDGSTHVMFKKINRKIIFQAYELKKVKKNKK
jgi:hypothetical protein